MIKLFDARTPGNVLLFTDFFEELTSGKLVDTFIERMFYVPDQDPYSVNYQQAGYTTVLFIINSQDFLFNGIMQTSLILVLIILIVVVKKKP